MRGYVVAAVRAMTRAPGGAADGLWTSERSARTARPTRPGVLSGAGVVVAAVPWARHGVGYTLGFHQTVAWLATTCAKSAVTELMRIA